MPHRRIGAGGVSVAQVPARRREASAAALVYALEGASALGPVRATQLRDERVQLRHPT